MSEENYNCPHCGSEPLWIGGYPTPSGKALLKRRQCGSLIDTLYPANEERSELCLEREARLKAEADYKDTLALLERRNGEVGKAEAEKQKLREARRRNVLRAWSLRWELRLNTRCMETHKTDSETHYQARIKAEAELASREARRNLEAQNAILHKLLERALVVEPMTRWGGFELCAIRDQYDLLKHSSGGAL